MLLKESLTLLTINKTFLGSLSIEIRSRLRKCFKNYNPYSSLKVVEEHFGITSLTCEFFKTPKKSAIFDHMLLDGHKTSFDNFSILSKENNAFKLQLKESL